LDLGNWRPISLLCHDYKILTSVFAARVQGVIHKVIPEDQQGFINTRSMVNCIHLVQAIIRHHREEDRHAQAWIVFLDQMKAYDRVDWTFLREVLLAVGFGPRFLGLVDAINNEPTAHVLINGFRSRRVRLERGVRQGDPLSCALFNFAIEALAWNLRAHPALAGIRPPRVTTGQGAVVQMFADDTAIMGTTQAELDAVWPILAAYERASGARVNTSKSIGLSMPPGRFAGPPDLPWATAGESFRYLGAQIGWDISLDAFWDSLAGKVEKALAGWAHRPLSLTGRVLIIKAIGLSRLWYFAQFEVIPPKVAARVQAVVRWYLWRGKAAGMVREKVAFMRKEEGGLGVPEVEASARVLQIRAVERLLAGMDGSGPCPRWVPWVARYLDRVGEGPPTDMPAADVLRSTIPLGGASGPLGTAVPFWREALEGAAEVVRRNQAAVKKDPPVDHILAEHLWYNNRIKDTTVAGGRRGHQANGVWFTKGIRSIGDIYRLCDGEPSTTEGRALWRRNTGLSVKALDKVMAAIPGRWKELAFGSTPPARTRQEANPASARRVAALLDPSSDPKPLGAVERSPHASTERRRIEYARWANKAKIDPEELWRQRMAAFLPPTAGAATTHRRPGQRDTAPTAAPPTHASTAPTPLVTPTGGAPAATPPAATNTTTDRTPHYHRQLPAPKPATYADVQRRVGFWRSAWLPTLPKRWQDTLWRLRHNAIPMGSRLRWLPAVPTCVCGTTESVQHTFVECRVLKRPIAFCTALLFQWRAYETRRRPDRKITAKPNLFESLFDIPAPYKGAESDQLPRIVHTAFIMAVWRARCSWAMEGQAYTGETVELGMKAALREALGLLLRLASRWDQVAGERITRWRGVIPSLFGLQGYFGACIS
ncbi:MAG: reverse transcriptase domain-containing protein, partial [Hyphomonadaceae bacterium]